MKEQQAELRPSISMLCKAHGTFRTPPAQLLAEVGTRFNLAPALSAQLSVPKSRALWPANAALCAACPAAHPNGASPERSRKVVCFLHSSWYTFM